jgi:hypothetical protein
MVNVHFVVQTFMLLVRAFVMIHVTDMLNDMIWNLDWFWMLFDRAQFYLGFDFQMKIKITGLIIVGHVFYSGLNTIKILLGQKNYY